jgi:hypothetical protein
MLADRDIPRSGEQYGSAVVHLNSRVKNRTTWTGGDSLDATYGGSEPNMRPSPVLSPSEASVPLMHRGMDFDEIAEWAKVGGHKGMHYHEAQIFGGVPVSDIDRVVFDLRPYRRESQDAEQYARRLHRRMLEKLDRLGVPYKFEWGE